MSFQLPTTTTGATSGFSFGLTATTTANQVKQSFGSLGGGDAGAPKPITFGTQPTTNAPPATSGPTATTGAGMFGSASLPTASAAPTVASSFTFGAPAASSTTAATTAPAMLGMPKTTAPSLSQGPPTTTSISGLGGGGFANLTTATKTTNSSAATNAAQLSYNQLEEHINKWTLELEEQEKVFTDQATQINAWDKVLISNNQKILELNDAVQKVKADQQTLEQELEFISTQHKELDESILPLQKEFMNIPPADVERSLTYMLVENLDTQLKQMSEDLKEIIDNLNEANKGQDNSDPIIQIGKILNAHMSSLQWIEASSASMSNKLEDLTKMHDTFKRDSERSFRSAYYK